MKGLNKKVEGSNKGSENSKSLNTLWPFLKKRLGIATKHLRNPTYPKLDDKTIGEIIKIKESVKETIILNIC